jgi:hypothetical protein
MVNLSYQLILWSIRVHLQYLVEFYGKPKVYHRTLLNTGGELRCSRGLIDRKGLP